MSWNNMANRPTTGQHRIVMKLPVGNIVLLGKFEVGKLMLFDQENQAYVDWDTILPNIVWREIPPE